MPQRPRPEYWWRRLPWRVGLGLLCAAGSLRAAGEPAPPPTPVPAPPAALAMPAPEPDMRALPITLPAALQLTQARAIDIAAAAARIRQASARLEQARVLWLPTVAAGIDYYRHDGQIQNVEGQVFGVSKSTLMFGAGSGPAAAGIIPINEAIFAPIAARLAVQARQAAYQAATNDTFVAATDAYFTVQQARGELAGAEDATRRAEELVRRIGKLAAGLVPPLEAVRAEAELARRQQAELLARERWRVASAELVRVLRLDPTTQLVPLEAPHLRVNLIDLDKPLDDWIPVALLNRPELAAQRAEVQATLVRLRQERLRPLTPSLLLRGASTNPAGTLGVGAFGGGVNSTIGNYSARFDVDVQLLWQLDNLGFGNRARVHSAEADRRLALIELFRTQDRIAAEVSQAYSQAKLAARRVEAAERGVKLALDSAELNLIGIGQTRRVGDLVQTVVRPQEAVAAVQSLAQAYADYYAAVADSNRAHFRLYRALGQPAQELLPPDPACAPAPPGTGAPVLAEPPPAQYLPPAPPPQPALPAR